MTEDRRLIERVYTERVKALPIARVLGVYRELHGNDRGNTLDDIQALIEQDFADYPDVAFLDCLPTEEDSLVVDKWTRKRDGSGEETWWFTFADGFLISMMAHGNVESMNHERLRYRRHIAAMDHVEQVWKDKWARREVDAKMQERKEKDNG